MTRCKFYFDKMRTCIDLDRLGVSSFRSCRGFNNIFIILDFDFYIHVSFKVVPYFSTYRSNCGISLRFETSCTYRILFNKAKTFFKFQKKYTLLKPNFCLGFDSFTFFFKLNIIILIFLGWILQLDHDILKHQCVKR